MRRTVWRVGKDGRGVCVVSVGAFDSMPFAEPVVDNWGGPGVG